MIDKVSCYLNEILVPALRRFAVSEAYAAHIADIVEMQMASCLRHWDDVAFRKTLLLTGAEEASFYEPAAKLDVKCFVVVTLRNSPLETVQSNAYEEAGLTHCLTDGDVKTITGSAVRYFGSADFPAMCAQARRSAGADFYRIAAESHPVAWAALKALAMTAARTADYPAVKFESPFLPAAFAVPVEQEQRTGAAARKVVVDAYADTWDPALRELIGYVIGTPGNAFVVDSMKSAARSMQKLLDIMEMLLTHEQSFVTANFYFENGHVERRPKLLRAAHTMEEMKINLSQTAGLGYRHSAALKHAMQQVDL